MARTILNTTDLMDPEWQFLRPKMPDPAYTWETHTTRAQAGLPGGVRMRRIQACLHAVRTAQRSESPILISHLPNMAALTNLARKIFAQRVPQIAFAFNFTDLPSGIRRAAYTRALRGIDEMVVFSSHEQSLYAEHLGIPSDRIRFLKWAMDAPKPGPRSPEVPDGPYVCAIGGEARDYALLAHAMRALPRHHAVIVARPYSVTGIDFPDNVQVHLNLPPETTWRLAVDSLGMVLPLRSRETMCGHITFVAAQLLGIPMVVTDTLGLQDYIAPETVFRTVPAKDLEALSSAIQDLYTQRDAAVCIATAGRTHARTENKLDHWVAYLQDAVERM